MEKVEKNTGINTNIREGAIERKPELPIIDELQNILMKYVEVVKEEDKRIGSGKSRYKNKRGSEREFNFKVKDAKKENLQRDLMTLRDRSLKYLKELEDTKEEKHMSYFAEFVYIVDKSFGRDYLKGLFNDEIKNKYKNSVLEYIKYNIKNKKFHIRSHIKKEVRDKLKLVKYLDIQLNIALEIISDVFSFTNKELLDIKENLNGLKEVNMSKLELRYYKSFESHIDKILENKDTK